MNELSKIIEGVLLTSGETISRNKLSRIVGKSKSAIDDALLELEKDLSERGIRLFLSGELVGLVSAPELSTYTKKLIHEELETNLSKSAIETLTIILYKAPVTRAAIDYIRGVNSSYTLQQLLTRGIIERHTNPQDSRSYVYAPSQAFIQHIGLTSNAELPEFGDLKDLGKEEIAVAENPQTDHE